MRREILDRYARTADDKLIISIATDRIEDLYNNFDKHTPYVKKELDQNLTEYLIDSVSEIGDDDFVIQFTLPVRPNEDMMSRVRKSIQNYFIYLKELESREMARMTRTSFILFFIGVIILFLSVWINEQFAVEQTVIVKVFAEGLNVAAWVSLWNAIATFLINWQPHRRQIKMYDNVSKASVLFQEATLDIKSL